MKILIILAFLVSCTSIEPINRHETIDRSDESSLVKLLNEVEVEKTSKKVKHAKASKKIRIEEPEVVIIERKPSLKKTKRVKLDKVRIKESSISKPGTKESPLSTFKVDYSDKHFNFWLKYFTKKEKERFQRHLRNGDRYEEVVKSVFREMNLPEDLYYVGLIESGYNTHIRSRASAVGPWQFIKGTAKRYNLKVSRSIDERRNIVKATRAAGRYFKDLYNIFGSWELALCAYNKGEYGIIRAIRKGKTRDYEKLIKMKLLPKETVYYIPKVVAAREIDKNRKKYGIRVKKVEPMRLSEVSLKRVPGRVSLRHLAKKLRVSHKSLKALNPDFRRNAVHYRKGVDVVIPASKKVAFSKLSFKSSRKLSRSKDHGKIYKVRSGDNLSTIASRYGMSLRSLKRMNRIRGSKIYVGQRLRVTSESNDGKIHVVRKGDNLYSIAKRYGVKISRLVAINNIDGHRIFPNQKIVLPSNM